MKIYLIRHGKTKGNREHRYVGITDEGLLAEAARSLAGQKMPPAARVYVSPMRRCRETAEILYPGQAQIVIEGFRECDFGKFENKNYEELNGDADYQRFIDTMGESGFPGGEDIKSFQKRCVESLEEVLRQEACRRTKAAEVMKTGGEAGAHREQETPCAGEVPETADEAIALVVHGGTIMALLDHFSSPHRGYYDWQVGNGCGFSAEAVKEESDGSWTLRDIRPIGEQGTLWE